MTIYVALMFVVGVLSPKDSRTDGAGEMFNVVFAI